MSYQTPKRLSLRRKRPGCSMKGDIPSPKKRSPSIENDLGGKNQHKQASSSTSNDHVAQSHAPPTTPKTPLRYVAIEKPDGILGDHGLSRAKESDQKYNQELSPSYSPFALSQMPSTQDCEVIWDCNSPGFSKEDLKKMYEKSGNKTSTPSPIAPVPNRLLFNHYKPKQLPVRLGAKNSSVVVEELDNLLTKINGELSKQVELPLDEEKDDDKVCSLLSTSSQSFDVSHLEENLKATDLTPNSCLQKEVNGHAANIDSEKIMNGRESSTQSVHQNLRSSCSKLDVGGDSVGKNISLSSLDDDIFNESFLKSTQALEEAYLNKERCKFDPCSQKRSPMSRIRKKKPTILSPDTNDKLADYSENAKGEHLISNKIIIDSLDPVSPSPIIGKVRKSPEAESGLCTKVGSLIGKREESFCAPTPLSNTEAIKEEIKPLSQAPKPRFSFQLDPLISKSSCKNDFKNPIKKEESKLIKTSQTSPTKGSNMFPVTAKQRIGSKPICRSGSENGNITVNPLVKKRSFDSSIDAKNSFQEYEDDDEIFAALIPSLVEVEAQHAISQCVGKENKLTSLPKECSNGNFIGKEKYNSGINNAFKSTQQQSVSSASSGQKVIADSISTFDNKTNPCLSTIVPKFAGPSAKENTSSGFSRHNNKAKYSSFCSTFHPQKSFNPLKINPINKCRNGKEERKFVSYQGSNSTRHNPDVWNKAKTSVAGESKNLEKNSISFPKKLEGTTTKPSCPEPLRCQAKSSSILDTGQKSSLVPQTSTINAANDVIGCNGEDDDDLFMQADVLDYISEVEAQYAASQTKISGNSKPSKNHLSLQTPATQSHSVKGVTTQFNRSNSVNAFSKQPSSYQSNNVKCESERNPTRFVKTEIEANPLTTTQVKSQGPGFSQVTKTLSKVTRLTNKVNQVLLGKTEVLNTTPVRSREKSSCNLNESISNEDFLNNAFEENLFDDSFLFEAATVVFPKTSSSNRASSPKTSKPSSSPKTSKPSSSPKTSKSSSSPKTSKLSSSANFSKPSSSPKTSKSSSSPKTSKLSSSAKFSKPSSSPKTSKSSSSPKTSKFSSSANFSKPSSTFKNTSSTLRPNNVITTTSYTTSYTNSTNLRSSACPNKSVEPTKNLGLTNFNRPEAQKSTHNFSKSPNSRCFQNSRNSSSSNLAHSTMPNSKNNLRKSGKGKYAPLF